MGCGRLREMVTGDGRRSFSELAPASVTSTGSSSEFEDDDSETSPLEVSKFLDPDTDSRSGRMGWKATDPTASEAGQYPRHITGS